VTTPRSASGAPLRTDPPEQRDHTPSSRLDRAALWAAGAYLTLFLVGALVFMLTVERDHMGSWRAVVANYTGTAAGVLVFGACAMLLLRAGWLRRTPPHPRREQGMRFVLAAVCGATGAVLAALLRGEASRLPGVAVDGAVWGTSALVMAWLMSRLLGRTRSVPPTA
jgi:hypothetical protein